jgi:sec-independent protein translocase protein TatA
MKFLDILAIGPPGTLEIVVILFFVILLFGPKKLPDLSRAIGKSIGEFKKGRQEIDEELKKVHDDDDSDSKQDGNLS